MSDGYVHAIWIHGNDHGIVNTSVSISVQDHLHVAGKRHFKMPGHAQQSEVVKLSAVMASLSMQDITCAIGVYAGPSSWRAMLQIDKVVRTALRAMPPSMLEAIFPTHIYVLGGFGPSGFGSGTAYSDAERYDLATGMWELLPSMQVPRFGLTAITHRRKIYVCGGFSRGSSRDSVIREPLSSVECFNPDESSWMAAPPMSCGRLGAAGTTVANRLYVCGGGTVSTEGWHTLRSTESFDEESGSWEPSLPMFTPRCYASAATMRGCLYVCGGTNGIGLTPKRTAEFVDIVSVSSA